jgi:hypothetical protein
MWRREALQDKGRPVPVPKRRLRHRTGRFLSGLPHERRAQSDAESGGLASSASMSLTIVFAR